MLDLSGLNPQQREAVTHGTGPLLVLAGAGSGKTRVITYRIAYLMGEMNVRPANILAVTFTNKAAAEMLHRVDQLVPPTGGYRPWIGTFHSTSLRMLRRLGQRADSCSSHTPMRCRSSSSKRSKDSSALAKSLLGNNSGTATPSSA